jgi:hypothetical protein
LSFASISSPAIRAHERRETKKASPALGRRQAHAPQRRAIGETRTGYTQQVAKAR